MTDRVEIDVATDEVDWVSGLLWTVGVDAVEERDGAVAGRTTLVTAPDSPALRAVLGDRWPVRVLPVDDSVLDTWRAWAVPVRCGRLLVLPSWFDASGDADAGVDAAVVRPGGVSDGGRPVEGETDVEVVRRAAEVVVRIDPGRAFGHGAHPTTRAVLEQVVAQVAPGSTVLDVGCGSGVLAVAAAALGADRVVAVDIDDEAVRATRANASGNGVADRVTVSTTPLAEVTGTYDIVVANIGAATLVELADDLAGRVAPGGALVLSGLLADRRDEVVAAFPDLVVDAEVVDDGWCTLVLLRR